MTPQRFRRSLSTHRVRQQRAAELADIKGPSPQIHEKITVTARSMKELLDRVRGSAASDRKLTRTRMRVGMELTEIRTRLQGLFADPGSRSPVGRRLRLGRKLNAIPNETPTKTRSKSCTQSPERRKRPSLRLPRVGVQRGLRKSVTTDVRKLGAEESPVNDTVRRRSGQFVAMSGGDVRGKIDVRRLLDYIEHPRPRPFKL